MKVVVVQQHHTKTTEWFNRAKGVVFPVIKKRDEGYDADMAPLGHPPGTRGWLWNEEVVEVAEEAGKPVES